MVRNSGPPPGPRGNGRPAALWATPNKPCRCCRLWKRPAPAAAAGPGPPRREPTPPTPEPRSHTTSSTRSSPEAAPTAGATTRQDPGRGPHGCGRCAGGGDRPKRADPRRAASGPAHQDTNARTAARRVFHVAAAAPPHRSVNTPATAAGVSAARGWSAPTAATSGSSAAR